MAKRNFKSILLGTSDFNSDEYLDEWLLFDFEKSSEEKFFDRTLERIPDNDTYYIEHRKGTNAFRIRKDERQGEKEKIINFINDLQMNKSINKL